MLLVSMTSGAVILMILGDNPPSAGAFCLSSYYKLASADQVVASHVGQATGRWWRIEICYSGTRGGNTEWLAYLQGLPSPQVLDYHFVICNGFGGEDGQILATQRWGNQQWVRSTQTGYPSDGTIRICLVADGRSACATDCQIKRVESLVDTLCKQLAIAPESVSYPGDMTAAQTR